MHSSQLFSECPVPEARAHVPRGSVRIRAFRDALRGPRERAMAIADWLFSKSPKRPAVLRLERARDRARRHHAARGCHVEERKGKGFFFYFYAFKS